MFYFARYIFHLTENALGVQHYDNSLYSEKIHF